MVESYWAFTNHKRKSLTDLICVLDVDETLVHTFDNFESWGRLKIMTDPKKMDLRSRCYVLNIEANKSNKTGAESMWGVKRPHLNKFLEFCFTYFKYVIPWSAGIFDYVHEIVDNIFIDTLAPHAVLTRTDCVGPIGYLEKPLARLIERIPALKGHISIDELNLRDNIKNVIIIDDRKKSFAQNPHNGILIPVYEPVPTVEDIRRNDVALLQIMSWLTRPDVMKSTDVRKLDKSSIFANFSPAIMSGDISGIIAGVNEIKVINKIEVNNTINNKNIHINNINNSVTYKRTPIKVYT